MKILLITNNLPDFADLQFQLEQRGHRIVSAISLQVAMVLMDKNRDVEMVIIFHLLLEREVVQAVHYSFKLLPNTQRVLIPKEPLTADVSERVSELCQMMENADELMAWVSDTNKA